MGAGEVVEQFTRQAASFARLPSHEEVTELLLDMAGVSDGTKMLDVACGPGMAACAAARRVGSTGRVTGVDLTPAMIEQARVLQAKLGLVNVEWQVGEAAALPFPAASFDAVTTRYSMHHIADPDEVVAELTRVARPGARIAIADMVMPRVQGATYDRMERLRDPSHVRTLAREALITLAVAAGLRDIRAADYPFTVDLERLMLASFPEPGNAERVRAMFEADIGADRMGLSLRREGGMIKLTYPVTIVAGVKA
jgi:ubiquinone/menaquinone biosynthesis C-methylase UbiE